MGGRGESAWPPVSSSLNTPPLRVKSFLNLGKWGFASQAAADLLADLPESQPVAEQLEYREHESARQGTWESGLGFKIAHCLRNGFSAS